MRASTHVNTIRTCTHDNFYGIMRFMAESYATQFARKGGKARAAKLTQQERSESARRAAEARWAKFDKTLKSIDKTLTHLERKNARLSAARVKQKERK